MTIETRYDKDHQQMMIFINGQFDFNLQADFRKAYDHQDIPIREYQVDLSKTTYLDSSALGMLLILKEFGEHINAKVRLNNPPDEIKNILHLSNFDKIFDIQES